MKFRRCGRIGEVPFPPLRTANRFGFRLESPPTADTVKERLKIWLSVGTIRRESGPTSDVMRVVQRPTFKLLQAPIGRAGKVSVRRCGRIGKVSCPPLRKQKTSAGRSKRTADAAREKACRSEGKTFRGPPLRKAGTSRGAVVAAAKMNRPPDSKRLPTADQGYSRQPIRRRREWNRSRFGGRKNGGRADLAEGRMVEEPILRKAG